MAIIIMHVTCNWVIFRDFASSDSMPHGNNTSSLNMHATALVYISIDCHCHCKFIDMQTMSIACLLRGHIFSMMHAA